MVRIIRAELLKLRRNPLWLAFFVLPLFPAFFGTVNYMNNLEILQKGWYSLWTQHTLFSCYFFLPLVVGVYCACLWRMEHSGHNWNQTLSLPVKRASLVLSKLSLALVMSAAMLGWTFLLYILCGLLCGIDRALPPELLEWFICGLAGAAAICAVQLFLSLVLRSFAAPVGLAMVGGVLGLMMLAKDLALWCPYSLLCLGMRANNPELEISYAPFLISCAAFTLLFTAASVLYLRLRDVQAA